MSNYPRSVTRQKVLAAFELLGIDLDDVESVNFAPQGFSIARSYRDEAGQMVWDSPSEHGGPPAGAVLQGLDRR